MIHNHKLLAASSAAIVVILVIGGFIATSGPGGAQSNRQEIGVRVVHYSGGIPGNVPTLLPPPHRPEIAAVAALHFRPSWMRKHQSRNCLTAGAHFDLFCWTSTIFTR
ncbi:hypothetical protein HF289_03420 [Acidithiobacillus ferrooxidans]|uniref:hypothetical protein n=1 Tax=Acidithiobacillus ferrooxidans TaxID=920 RepID=UPI001C07CA63|nr:hypothetical protein [Acidithiobacillus ferrooxidans]MBU2855962.1 hypothetical protein [Acidithiobacillus ferrooxidans]